jgi:hypothetical protein
LARTKLRVRIRYSTSQNYPNIFTDEELIKHGWEEDVWFHVDNLSSAHIYVRLPDGESWENMNKELLTDCAQLTKANSIEGNKKDNVTVIYTPWSNLKKDGSMAVGQVGFKDQKKVSSVMACLHLPGNCWMLPRRCYALVLLELGDLIASQVKRIHVEKRENPIVNRLNKTKVEKFPDLREEKEARLKELGRRDRDAQQLRVSEH